MAKTANLNIRMDPEIKAEAEALFSTFGMTVSDAVNIFLHQALLEGGLPFAVRQPRYNAETEAAMAEARAILDGRIPAKRYDSVQDMMAAIDAGADGEC